MLGVNSRRCATLCMTLILLRLLLGWLGIQMVESTCVDRLLSVIGLTAGTMPRVRYHATDKRTNASAASSC